MTIVSLSGRLDNLKQRDERTERWIKIFSRAENRFPWVRLAILVLGLICNFLAFQLLPFLLAWLSALIFLYLFGTAAFQHNRLLERIKRLKGFQSLLKAQIARLELDWNHIPPAGDIQTPTDHPYACDLNLTGARSIHQLLDTAVSMGGSQRLATWLLQAVPDPSTTIKRQLLVQELVPRTSFRTRLELNGMLASPDPAHRWDTGAMLRWLESRSKATSLKPLLIALGALALANLILYCLNALGLIPPLWIATIAIYLGLQAFNYRESSEVFEEAYSLGRQLGQLRTILADLETYPYAPGTALSVLSTPFTQSGQRPSAALRQVSRIISAASLRNNPFLGLILNLLMPWDVFFAYKLEQIKHSLRNHLPTWLETWYEIEGLVSISNYAALHPEFTFPEMNNMDTRPILSLSGVGHPLIPIKDRVANDFILNNLGEIVLVSGSNMSGKSTFLRTIGVNLVLAFAGSPIPAQKMSTIPLRLFTSMSVSDSLNDGISFFYAEVRRLKELLDALESNHPYPLLFLIDEIFRGTNNRERQIGSRAYTRALTGGHGAGFLSTHDLELTNLADENLYITNFHFKESIQDGRMVFDYKIHRGASPTTNALRIMSLAGLPLPPEDKNL